MNETHSFDISTIENLKGLMKDRFSLLIETFFINTEKQLEDLQTAIDTSTTEDIIAVTHTIKGSSGSVGAVGMQKISAIYEIKARQNDMDDNSVWTQTLTMEFNRYKSDIQSYL